jgi:phage-related minor tail protein
MENPESKDDINSFVEEVCSALKDVGQVLNNPDALTLEDVNSCIEDLTDIKKDIMSMIKDLKKVLKTIPEEPTTQ